MKKRVTQAIKEMLIFGREIIRVSAESQLSPRMPNGVVDTSRNFSEKEIGAWKILIPLPLATEASFSAIKSVNSEVLFNKENDT